MPVWSDPAKCESRLVLALYEWWLGKGGADAVPDRGALDPAEIKHLLPNILIAEAEHEPFRIRYRLSGTRITEITGLDISGHYLDDLLSAEPDQPWLAHYRAVYESGRPLFGLTTVPMSTGGVVDYEFGIFPLRSGDHRVGQFIALEDYFRFQGTLDQIEPWRIKSRALL